MYTLRTVTENQVKNQFLGDSYIVVSKEFNQNSFRHYYLSTFGKDYDGSENTDIVKFVVTSQVFPIYKHESIYVLSSGGETLECLNNPKRNGV